MELVLVVVAVLVLVALLLVLALGVAAKRAERGETYAGWLMAVASLRSPSGRPFFPNQTAVRRFVDDVDDAKEIAEENLGR